MKVDISTLADSVFQAVKGYCSTEFGRMFERAIEPFQKRLEEIPAGKDGAPGPQGEKGIDGAPGQKGDPGIDGKDGRDGRDGVDGKDGERGPKGEPGKDGRDGKDAAPSKPVSYSFAIVRDKNGDIAEVIATPL